MRRGSILFFFVMVSLTGFCQLNYDLQFTESTTLTQVPAVHSGAYTSWMGKYIFIGGRSNGLHGFQPPFAFPNSGKNEQVYVLDANSNQLWNASVTGLPVSVYESITSSNMQFYREDSILWMIGGYGWCDAAADFKTFPTLTAVNLNTLVPAVMQGNSIAPAFHQITDSRMAVCGGHLEKIDSIYQLVFGHRFDGRYARHDSMGFFDQQYTNEVRRFRLVEQAGNIAISGYNAIYDSLLFHRRDYNLIPQYDAFGRKSLTAFSGVFQYNQNLPYTSLIDIYDTLYYERQGFEQQLSHYHSAVCALYDTVWLTQYNLFFGGMSMYYYDSAGVFQTDLRVPFVKTVSLVARDMDANYHELRMPTDLPGYLGTNAYFLPAPQAPLFRESVLHFNLIPDNGLIGYLVGGIESPEPNISDTDPSMSYASPKVWEVRLDRTPTALPERLGDAYQSIQQLRAVPNPSKNKVRMIFQSDRAREGDLLVYSADGKLLERFTVGIEKGENQFEMDLSRLSEGVYFLSVGRKAVRWVKTR